MMRKMIERIFVERKLHFFVSFQNQNITLSQSVVNGNFSCCDRMTRRLMNAVHIGEESIICSLLEEGIDINSQDRYGYTALHNASCNGQNSIVSLLLKNGANVNVQNHVS